MCAMIVILCLSLPRDECYVICCSVLLFCLVVVVNLLVLHDIVLVCVLMMILLVVCCCGLVCRFLITCSYDLEVCGSLGYACWFVVVCLDWLLYLSCLFCYCCGWLLVVCLFTLFALLFVACVAACIVGLCDFVTVTSTYCYGPFGVIFLFCYLLFLVF